MKRLSGVVLLVTGIFGLIYAFSAADAHHYTGAGLCLGAAASSFYFASRIGM